MTFERCVVLGLGLVGLGLTGTILALSDWGQAGFGDLDPRGTIRLVLPSATAIGLGVIGIFSGLFSSLLTLRGVSSGDSAASTPKLPRQRGADRQLSDVGR